MKEKILLIGGGSHCKACIDVIEQEGVFDIHGVIEKIGYTGSSNVLGYRILGTEDDLSKLRKHCKYAIITRGHFKTPQPRMRLYQLLKKLDFTLPVISSPMAYVSRHATVAEGSIIMPHAIVNAGARVGKNCIVSAAAIIGPEAIIEDYCHIGNRTAVTGGVHFSSGTYFGSGTLSRESDVIAGSKASNAKSIFWPSIKRPIKIGVFGASGFSREVIDILHCDCIDELVYIDLPTADSAYFGLRVVPEERIAQLVNEGYYFVIGIGDNRLRKKIYERYKHLSFPNIIHPTASFGYKQLENVKAKKGNIITAGVRFTNNIELGNFGIYNLNSTVGHDCIFEDFVNIAPGANLSGNVLVREGAYIGTNAAVLQGTAINDKLVIGKYATAGAGALVNKEVDAFAVVTGVPAKSKNKK